MSLPLAVFDIDGVVADVRHRLHHLEREPKNWGGFFAGAADDPPLAEGRKLALELAADHEVVWLTGRPERLRPVTEAWLAAHGLPVGRLLMRGDQDRRPARLTKTEHLRRLARTDTVAIVIDDDPDVVAALAGAGLPVRLADWVPHGSTLQVAQEEEGRT